MLGVTVLFLLYIFQLFTQLVTIGKLSPVDDGTASWFHSRMYLVVNKDAMCLVLIEFRTASRWRCRNV
jgi:hypothetical protein